MARELYPMFANTKHHSADGVGREAYSVQDLLAPSFRFEERDTIALKNSAAHTASRPHSEEPDSGNGRL